jgi:hypothetical protein
LDPLKTLQYFNELNKVQITQDKITESVGTLEVMDGGTSSLETTFLKCQTIRSARLSNAVLKEFYLFYLVRCKDSTYDSSLFKCCTMITGK